MPTASAVEEQSMEVIEQGVMVDAKELENTSHNIMDDVDDHLKNVYFKW